MGLPSPSPRSGTLPNSGLCSALPVSLLLPSSTPLKSYFTLLPFPRTPPSFPRHRLWSLLLPEHEGCFLPAWPLPTRPIYMQSLPLALSFCPCPVSTVTPILLAPCLQLNSTWSLRTLAHPPPPSYHFPFSCSHPNGSQELSLLPFLTSLSHSSSLHLSFCLL